MLILNSGKDSNHAEAAFSFPTNMRDYFLFYSLTLPEKLEYIVNKNAEHSHDKWAYDKVENVSCLCVYLSKIDGIQIVCFRGYQTIIREVIILYSGF